jgi:subtilisin family serine protease
MIVEERYKITSNDYTDLFVEYNRNPNLLNRFLNETTQIIDTRFAMTYVPNTLLDKNFISKYGFSTLPRLFGLTSEKSLEASGVQRLRKIPKVNLRGKGILIGIIDTGIEYTNPIFVKEDGTSKVVRIWDQTIESDKYPVQTLYGTEYNKEQINQALKSTNPFDIVPSKDEIGHGTMLAGVAVGNEVLEKDFTGVVPDAELLVVKLKQAKPVLRTFFEVSQEVNCYQENDILWGVDYIRTVARELNRPVAICIGLGTSQGSHNGRGPLNNFVYYSALLPNTTICVSAGNEGNKKRHFFSEIDSAIGYSTMELQVGENETGFSMEIWGSTPNTYSIDILSPTGEYTPRIIESFNTNQRINHIFEGTSISIDYQILETHSGDQLILLRFHKPSSGLWKINVYTKGDLKGACNSWLPMGDFISANTYFMKPDSDTTITAPGDSFTPITVTAYNPTTNSLYSEASRGYTRYRVIKPELAAPGVNVVVPTLNQGFGLASGTSVAAAHTAGITAMMLEWGMIQGNYPGIDSIAIKEYLIRGAKREKTITYPNRQWGYGVIDVYGVFNILSQSK